MVSVLGGGILWLALDVTSCLSVFVAARTGASRKGRSEESYISVLRGGVLWLAFDVTSSLSVIWPRRRGGERRTLFFVLRGGVLWLALDVTSSLYVFVAARTGASRKGRTDEEKGMQWGRAFRQQHKKVFSVLPHSIATRNSEL